MVYTGTSVSSYSSSNYGNFRGSTTYDVTKPYNGGGQQYQYNTRQYVSGNMAPTFTTEPGMWRGISCNPNLTMDFINDEGSGEGSGEGKKGRGRKGRRSGGSGGSGGGGKKIKRGKTSMGRRTIQNSNSNRADRELAGNLTNYNEDGTLEFEGIEDSVEDVEITERKMRRNAEANWSLRMNSIFPKNGELD